MNGHIKAKERGFTMVEMLVALAIFSMISVAGVALLQSAASSQLVVKERLSDLSETARAIAVMESDLAQAIARPVRTTVATTTPAFSANGLGVAGQIFALTRAGQANLDDAPKPELQHVAYALENGALKRISWSMLDGGKAQPTILLKDVKAATVRFRDAEGNWRSDWDASDPLALPRALELELTQNRAAQVRLLFLVGTGGAKAPVKEGEGGDEPPT